VELIRVIFTITMSLIGQPTTTNDSGWVLLDPALQLAPGACTTEAYSPAGSPDPANDYVQITVCSKFPNNAPVGTIADQSIGEGDPFSLDLSTVFSDPEGQPMTFAVTGLPAFLAFDGTVISGTPADGDNGVYTITPSATDDQGATGFAPFTLTVNDTITPPPVGLNLLASYVPAPGQWALVPGTAFDSVRLPDGNAFGTLGQSSAVLDAWTGAAYDPAGHVLYLFGGGHFSYSGNEVYSLDLETLALARLNDPAPLTDLSTDPEGCPLPGTGPSASHTYSGFVWSPPTQSAFMFSEMNFADQNNCVTVQWGGNWLSEFDPATNTWARRATYSELAVGDDHAISFPMCGYSDATGLIYCLEGNRRADLYVYDPVARAMVCKDTQAASSFVQDGAARYRDGYLYFANKKGLQRMLVDAMDTVTCSVAQEEVVAPQLPGFTNSQGNWGFDIDALGRAVAWWGDNRVWVADLNGPLPAAWVEITPDPASSPTFMTTEGGNVLKGRIYTKWWYIPELDVFAAYQNRAEGLWLFKVP